MLYRSALLNLARSASEEDLVIVLISGGGSALLTVPAEGLTAADIQSTCKTLAAAGGDITALNTLRKHMSAVQGGRLAAACYPARVLALVLSDVIGDRLDVIASGPTVVDESTYDDCLRIVEAYNVSDKIPASVLHHLQRGAAGEVEAAPTRDHPCFARTETTIIGSNRLALEACREAAQGLGYAVIDLGCDARGDACDLAARVLDDGLRAWQKAAAGSCLCLMCGGETTVKVAGSGRGGRCQHMALHAALLLATDPKYSEMRSSCCFLSAGTDGQDGPTDAAGAVVEGSRLKTAEDIAAARAALAASDSHTFWTTHHDDALIRTGLTGTNVMDLQLLLLSR